METHRTRAPRARYPVDLQVHTTCSDGTMTPEEVVAFAAQVGLKALAITDHDSVDGVDRALAAARAYGLEVVPAVELSLRNEPERGFVDLDLLGYWIDPHHPTFEKTLEKVVEGRIEQKRLQVARLQEMGYQITWEEVIARAKGVPGRPHMAEVLVAHHPDEFPTIQAAFEKILRSDGPIYVPRPFALRLEEAVHVIREAGGLPVLAHPGLYTHINDVDALVRRVRALGVEGLEVWYPYNKTRVCVDCSEAEFEALIAHFEALADELGMVKTGGSDFHGLHKPIALGEQGITWAHYLALKRLVEERRAT